MLSFVSFHRVNKKGADQTGQLRSLRLLLFAYNKARFSHLSREPLILLHVNNKVKEHTVHARSLFSGFVNLKSIAKLAACKSSLFWLISEAEQAGLSLTLRFVNHVDMCSRHKSIS